MTILIINHVEPIEQVEDDKSTGKDNTGDGINQYSLIQNNTELLQESRSWSDLLNCFTDITNCHHHDSWLIGSGSGGSGYDDEDPGVLEDGEEDEEDTGNTEGIKFVEIWCHIGLDFCTVEGIDNNEKEDDETTKPAGDDVGGDDEADPGDNDKEN